MCMKNCLCVKISLLLIVIIINILLIIVSMKLSYQELFAKEHIRFRKGLPSQANWIISPEGTLKCYLYNVTNAETFLNGSDEKLKLQQIGPIAYRIKCKNEVLTQSDQFMTYRKNRYYKTEFDPENSSDPDILNQTIILPNFVLLSAAAKLHDWVFLVRHAFNAITINESLFLNKTIYWFLWEFTTPALSMLSNYVPNIVENCGMLHNAVRTVDEIYNVKIGNIHGFENFFRVNSLNNKTFFIQQASRLKYARNKNSDVYCPITVSDAFENSLLPPYLLPETDIKIVARESCRTFQLQYDKNITHSGFNAYRYVIGDISTPSCLDNSMGIKLHPGLFDVSKCLFNEVPAAFSYPHFYGSSYNWSEHFEGFLPDQNSHETNLIVEPTLGIPIAVKYRFQSNIPLPDMSGYSAQLQRFSNMTVPTFWYEYDLDDLPPFVKKIMFFNVFQLPIIQRILIWIYFLITIYCSLKLYLLLKKKIL